MDTHKLERLFRAKYENILKDGEFSTSDAIYEKWVGYCDKHKILLLHPEWRVDSLNDNAMKGMVCIHSPECQVMNTASPWLLVPKKFAERALILGGLP
jgi:hypothetical protein